MKMRTIESDLSPGLLSVRVRTVLSRSASEAGTLCRGACCLTLGWLWVDLHVFTKPSAMKKISLVGLPKAVDIT